MIHGKSDNCHIPKLKKKMVHINLSVYCPTSNIHVQRKLNFFLWNGIWLSTYPRYVITPHIYANSTVILSHFQSKTKLGQRQVKILCFGHTKPSYCWKHLWFLSLVNCCCCCCFTDLVNGSSTTVIQVPKIIISLVCIVLKDSQKIVCFSSKNNLQTEQDVTGCDECPR